MSAELTWSYATNACAVKVVSNCDTRRSQRERRCIEVILSVAPSARRAMSGARGWHADPVGGLLEELRLGASCGNTCAKWLTEPVKHGHRVPIGETQPAAGDPRPNAWRVVQPAAGDGRFSGVDSP